MPGLVINGKEVEVPGVVVRNFKDDPRLALRVGKPDGNNDGKTRTARVSLVVIHTTKGIPGGSDKREQVIKPGFGPDTKAEERTATYWSTDPTPSGAHIVVDHDGSVGCLADLQTVCAYHAGQSDVNNRSIGIEIFQGSGAEMYQSQLHVVRKIVDVITLVFGIQRQIPSDYRNKPIPRLQELGGRNLYGVVGHRDVSDQRGKGDPGDAIMNVLADSGYERFNFFANEDLTTWKSRQQEIKAKLGREIDIDGVPGGETNTALKELGYQYGLWVFPPRSEDGTGLINSIIDAFLPTLIAAVGGDPKKAIQALSNWINRVG